MPKIPEVMRATEEILSGLEDEIINRKDESIDLLPMVHRIQSNLKFISKEITGRLWSIVEKLENTALALDDLTTIVTDQTGEPRTEDEATGNLFNGDSN